MAPIEIGWTIVCPPIKLIARDGKQLVDGAARIVVFRLSVRVSTQELQTAAEALRNAELQRVVTRIGSRLHLLNATGHVLLRRQRRAERRRENVESTIVDRLIQRDHLKQFRALRADITSLEQKVVRKLPLHVRVVLLNVRSSQLRIDKDAADRHADDRRQWRQR